MTQIKWDSLKDCWFRMVSNINSARIIPRLEQIIRTFKQRCFSQIIVLLFDKLLAKNENSQQFFRVGCLILIKNLLKSGYLRGTSSPIVQTMTELESPKPESRPAII